MSKIDTYTDNRLKIVCPYCGEFNALEAEDMPYEEDVSEFFDCTECNKNFELYPRITYAWESYKRMDDRMEEGK